MDTCCCATFLPQGGNETFIAVDNKTLILTKKTALKFRKKQEMIHFNQIIQKTEIDNYVEKTVDEMLKEDHSVLFFCGETSLLFASNLLLQKIVTILLREFSGPISASAHFILNDKVYDLLNTEQTKPVHITDSQLFGKHPFGSIEHKIGTLANLSQFTKKALITFHRLDQNNSSQIITSFHIPRPKMPFKNLHFCNFLNPSMTPTLTEIFNNLLFPSKNNKALTTLLADCRFPPIVLLCDITNSQTYAAENIAILDAIEKCKIQTQKKNELKRPSTDLKKTVLFNTEKNQIHNYTPQSSVVSAIPFDLSDNENAFDEQPRFETPKRKTNYVETRSPGYPPNKIRDSSAKKKKTKSQDEDNSEAFNKIELNSEFQSTFAKQELIQMQQQFVEASSALTEAKKKLTKMRELMSTNETLKKEQETFRLENEKLRSLIDKQEKQIYNEEKRNLNNENSVFDLLKINQHDVNEKKTIDFSSAITLLRNELLKSLNAHKWEQQAKEMREKILTLKKENNELKQENQSLKFEMNRNQLQTQIADIQKENETRIQKCENENNKLLAKINFVSKNYYSVKSALEEAEQERDKLLAENQKLKQSIQRSKAETETEISNINKIGELERKLRAETENKTLAINKMAKMIDRQNELEKRIVEETKTNSRLKEELREKDTIIEGRPTKEELQKRVGVLTEEVIRVQDELDETLRHVEERFANTENNALELKLKDEQNKKLSKWLSEAQTRIGFLEQLTIKK